ncbi:MAG: Holliday junction branch migration protein RuvA [Sorangiineae bacterium]|nr:Holliday junction branch migration protein RuvA [Polyangiaceae bacterium]MEB2322770.1 Holliday junction branch migration protein RuvA [Sorangiineae bacterium]
MIGRLTGTLAAEQLDGRVVLDVGGVGYELTVPLGATARAPRDGERLTFSVHTHVREDALELFGFASEAERGVFRLLITVPNVGPRTAINVLSALPTLELVQAVRAADVGRLTRVPGIGKKIAERLVLELKEKLPELPSDRPGGAAPPLSDIAGRLVTALVNMGYRPAEAERAVKSLEKELPTASLPELLREALAVLSG